MKTAKKKKKKCKAVKISPSEAISRAYVQFNMSREHYEVFEEALGHYTELLKIEEALGDIIERTRDTGIVQAYTAAQEELETGAEALLAALRHSMHYATVYDPDSSMRNQLQEVLFKAEVQEKFKLKKPPGMG